MSQTLINRLLVSRPGKRISFINTQSVLTALILGLGALAFWFLTTTTVINLGVGQNMLKSELPELWMHGDVVVMVRHAERCDRSGNPCLGSSDGITVKGGYAALAVGAGLQQLGLGKAELIASPLIRTRQTADFIWGREVAIQHWLSECNSGFKDAVLEHKRPGKNLVLITHSGCIDQFERKMDVRAGARSSAYTEAFFVQVDGVHSVKMLGSLAAAAWKDMSSEQLH